MNLDVLLVKAINASVKGGISVMDIYGSDFKVESKKDESPLTLADKNCNDVICSYLKNTGIPILSEEGIDIAFKDRQKWEYYWLVDPLDGTKEFVNRNGEFTVNIALIHFDQPVMGVVYVPVKEVMYFALEGLGSYMVRTKSIINDLEYLILNSTKLPINYNRKNYVVVGSRSHMSIETNQFINENIEHPDLIELYKNPINDFIFLSNKLSHDEIFAKSLYQDTGILSLPGSYLGKEVDGVNPAKGFLRLAVVHDIDTIEVAFKAVSKTLSNFS